MHPNAAFRPRDPASLLDLIAAVSFARIFLITPAGPRVAHAPLVVTPAGNLRFHLANGNALTPHLAGSTVLTLVEGPHSYLSANWYPDQRGAVPTWNYIAVEAQGVVRLLDRAELAELLDALAATLEPRVGEDWSRNKMDPARFEAMLGAITGFELAAPELRGTFKLSQNQPAALAAHLADKVAATGTPAVAAAMRAEREVRV